jgi:hypothetical protein
MPSNVDEMMESMLRNLEEKTGENLAQWLQIVNDSELTKHKEFINSLKSDYGLTYGYADLVALKSREAKEGAPPTGDSLVDLQYGGKRMIYAPFMRQ